MGHIICICSWPTCEVLQHHKLVERGKNWTDRQLACYRDDTHEPEPHEKGERTCVLSVLYLDDVDELD